MFDFSDGPRVFGLAPGIDFPAELVRGLQTRLAGHPPEAMARVELIVNTERMQRRIEALFAASGAALLPRIRLLSHPADARILAGLPRPVSPLRRRLELSQLVTRLLDAQPDLAARSSIFALSDSLAELLDDMQGEGVPFSALASLDVADQSGHWQRMQTVLSVLEPYFDATRAAPDAEGLRAQAVDRLIASWDRTPPAHPVIIAGSTGSRGTSHRLMTAVARLPQGAIVLPGFDFDLPGDLWPGLAQPMVTEDHPQHGFARLLGSLGIGGDAVLPWTDARPAEPGRNRLFSLALRPAPFTDQWRKEGPGLPDLIAATEGLSLLEAESPLEEAQAIAMCLRAALERGRRVALVTPDRMLTRRVTAALARWRIVPDDSAGVPPQLSPPGRLLRHVAGLFSRPLTAEALLAILKHPLTHSGGGRNTHNLNTRDLELHIRRTGMPFPTPERLLAWAERADRTDWANWVTETFCTAFSPDPLALSARVAAHVALAERVVAGSQGTDASQLWAEAAGREVRKLVNDLSDAADAGGALSARDYADLFGAVLSSGNVRSRDGAHPGVVIWGTLEARVMGADMLVLAGLNEGTWPEPAKTDPWLNRQMRARIGLRVPERQIGLAAHDFQQAVAVSEVLLSRSKRSEDAETVPSRWVNRLVNLMSGLEKPAQGAEALARMRRRGTRWIELARAADARIETPRAQRPAPCPPLVARPRELPVTSIRTLLRDPFAIYAQEILRLRPLDPLQRQPDYRERGIALHDLIEDFVRLSLSDPDMLDPERLVAFAADRLQSVPWPSLRPVWAARIARIADWFVETERDRRKVGHPAVLEGKGRARLEAHDFTLTARADRIDIAADGTAFVYDYKTGEMPSRAQQLVFEKQLLLEAAIVEQGGFDAIGPRQVAGAAYIGLSDKLTNQEAPLDEAPPAKVWAELGELIAAYDDPDRGYPSRGAKFKETETGRYDHLARLGEWDESQPPVTERLA